MDENKYLNNNEQASAGTDIPARKPAASPQPQSPAYSQRRAASSKPLGNEETVVRPIPQKKTVTPAAPVRPAAQNPQRRPAQPSQAQGQRPAQSPAYGQRRAPAPAEDSLPTRREPVAPARAPEKKAPKKAEKKEKPARENRSEKHKNTKAGADMMVSIVKAIVYMIIVLVVSVFISIYVIRVGNDVFAFVKSEEEIEITIPEDATVSDIADVLSENGIINFPGVFKMYANLKEEKGPFLAGDYTVTPSMSYDDLRRAFKAQVVTGTVWITIPEGYTTDEIIDLMVENGIGTREKYIDVINNYDFDYWFIDELEKSQLKEGRVYRLEGYLFPDTYEFYKSSSEEVVIGRLLKRFDEVFVEDYRTKAQELGYTVDEILTIASLIEKEAGGMGDFMYVSSVFHNRLNNPAYYPKLESDATTVYAIQLATGKRPDKITPEDNQFEHPYNTYLNAGLTPGPITNPSASAIRYALYPAKTGYYYFITDNAGKVYFASGWNEHQSNIELVKKVNEQLAET